MNEYKGISKQEFPFWSGWGHIALYESITNDFDDDKSLQRSVNLHYLKKKLYILLFNLIPYFIIGILYARTH